MRQVLGYEPGDKVTNHAGLVKYMEALAAAVPNRIKVFEYGESWEGRKLIYAAVGSEANIRKLGEIKSAIQRIADPAQNAGSRRAQADRRLARRGLALLRRPRQRDLFARRGAAHRLPPAGRAQRQDRGRRAVEGGGADRSRRRTPTAATAS